MRIRLHLAAVSGLYRFCRCKHCFPCFIPTVLTAIAIPYLLNIMSIKVRRKVSSRKTLYRGRLFAGQTGRMRHGHLWRTGDYNLQFLDYVIDHRPALRDAPSKLNAAYTADGYARMSGAGARYSHHLLAWENLALLTVSRAVTRICPGLAYRRRVL
ncbi:hypothetical protein KCP76_01775 [Salmonella enterica subsp. enterica serovar Weltevreden]|nr:hypothetical protein KCP76_01775 [Salmonella enterica subsp. enterica serovar Weltevreden]